LLIQVGPTEEADAAEGAEVGLIASLAIALSFPECSH